MDRPKTRGEYVALGIALVCALAALGSTVYAAHYRAVLFMYYAYGVAAALVFAMGTVSASFWLARRESKDRPEKRWVVRYMTAFLVIGALMLIPILILIVSEPSRDVSLYYPYFALLLLLVSNVVLGRMLVRLWKGEGETGVGDARAGTARRRWTRAGLLLGVVGCGLGWVLFGIHLTRLVQYHYYAY